MSASTRRRPAKRKARAGSPLAALWAPARPRRRLPPSIRRHRFLLAAGALALVMLLLLGYRVRYLGLIFPGVSVAGFDVGGRSPAEAQAALERSFAGYADQPLTLRYADWTWTPKPAELGLALDARAGVAAAYAATRPAHPLARLWSEVSARLLGRRVTDAGLTLDRSRLDSFLASIARQYDRPAVNAQLTIGEGPRIETIPERGGRRVNVEATRLLLERQLLRLGAAPVEVVVEQEAPKRREADLREEKALAERIIAKPLVIRYEDRQWVRDQAALASMLVFREAAAGGRAGSVVTLDETRLDELIGVIASEIDQPAEDARFDWAGGALKVMRPSREGRAVDRAAAVQLLRDKLTGSDRTLVLPVRVQQPRVAAADASLFAGAGLIVEAGSEYEGGSPEKIHNIELAVERLNGVVVPPGQLFSFNQELGPTTLKAGFKTGWGITTAGQQVETVPSVAGGICQVATALFQSVFWAGYQIEERNYHLYWIPRYGQPPRGLKGLDATVDAPTLDFKFTNTTDRPVLIQSWADGKRLGFALYGVKPSWEVTVEGPTIDGVVGADTTLVRQDEPSMPAGRELQVEAAQDGFTSTITRTVTLGSDVRTLKLISRYRPSRNVILVGTAP